MNADALARQAAEAIDTERVVELTQALVRIRSVFEPGKSSEAEAAHFVAEVLEEMGLEPLIEEVAEGRPNVIADWCGAGFDPKTNKTVMFEGHTDVVTEGDPNTWTHPPFGAEIVEGRLYGRGSADMKAGVAAALCATQAVIKTVPDLAGRIRLGFVADEEGMMLGIKGFIERGWAKGVDGAIVCEPEELELCLFQKGAMRVGITFWGVMSHGAMPYAGVNPIPALADFIQGVRELEAREQSRLGEHEHLGLPWFTPTVIRAPKTGEGQLNVMPETAYLTLDVRTVPGQNHQALLESLEEIGRGVEREGLEVSLDLIEERPWTETFPDDPLVGALERAHSVLDKTPRYGGVPGATDGTFLHAWAGVPIVTVGPGDRTIPHKRDEFVQVSDVVAAARLYAAAAVHFLSEPK